MNSTDRKRTPAHERWPAFLLLALTLIGLHGCATGAGGLGDESGPVRLPTGVRLVDSMELQCVGALHVSESSAVSGELRDEFFVNPGENATFRLGGETAQWACIREDDREFHRADCPADSRFIRFTRPAGSGPVLIECYR